MNQSDLESLIDVNVNLSRWPTRRSPDDETERLVRKLASRGVVEAWAGTFDGIFHKDLAAANARLVQECQQQQDLRLVPFGSVNPNLPGWEEDVRRCAENPDMPGIRLHPNYHGYPLDSPLFARLLEMATSRKLIVQLVVTMEDPRMMHPLLRVPAVDLDPLPALVRGFPTLKLVLLNALTTLKGEQLSSMLQPDGVFVELSGLEGLGGLERLLATISHERILFGSHAPSFYFESAQLKLRESQLAEFQRRAITYDNAYQLRTGASGEKQPR